MLNSEPNRKSNLKPGLEAGPDGHPIGRDPRQMAQAELIDLGHQPMSPLAAIRAHCLDCCAGSAHEVRMCTALNCASWPFRTGSNPWRAGKTEAQLEAARKLGEASRLRHSDAGTGREVSEGPGASLTFHGLEALRSAIAAAKGKASPVAKNPHRSRPVSGGHEDG